MNNQGKRVFITGGSRGIGLAIAKRFAQDNFDVLICSRSEAKLAQARETIEAMGEGIVKTYVCDVQNRDHIRQTAEAILQEFGYVDVMVNNAGVFIPGKISEENEEVFEKMMQTNLNSNYYMLKEFLPSFIRQKQGTIFNICSTASTTAYVNGGSYCISKFAQLGLTKVLRQEMIEHKVRVTAVLPGATLTDSWAGTDLPSDRFMQAEEVAEAVFQCYSLPTNTVVEELVLRPMEGDI